MNWLLALLSLLLTLACGDEPSRPGTEFGTIKIIDVQMEGASDLAPKYQFPDFARKYKMGATLVDETTLNPIPHTSFTIDLGIEGKISVKSDASGRINWNEIIKFNLLNPKKRILINRKISTKESPSSFQTIAYSFYPYAPYLEEDISEFLAGRSPEENYHTKWEAAKWQKNSFPINLNSTQMRLNYLGPSTQGGLYRIQLNSDVSLALPKSNGELLNYQIKNGNFAIEVNLYASNEPFSSSQLIGHKLFKNIQLIENKIHVDFKLALSISDFRKNIFAGIKLIPLSQQDQLRTFQGVYNLGKVKAIEGHHDLIFEKSYNSVHSSFQLPKSSYTIQVKNGKNINFSKLNLEYDMIEDGETPTWRSIIYRSSTCATDLHSREALAFEWFQIKKTSGEIINKESDRDGCLYWNERIEHKYYKPESFFTRTNTITHIESKITDTKTSYINPWTILTIGRDELEMDKDTLDRIASREVVHPMLFLAEYFYETIGVTYHIDEFMTLFVRKNIQLVLEFEVTRYSSLTDGINAREAIRDGVYLLKIAFEKSYIDTRKSQVGVEQSRESVKIKNSETRRPIEYIYIVHQLVRVWNGHIITPVELSIHDLRLMTVRSNFLMQLETIEQKHLDLSKNFDIEEIKTDRIIKKINENFPGQEPQLDLLVDKDSGLPTRTFAGPMVLLEIEGGAEVRPTDAMNVCETDDCNFLERNNQELQRRIYPHDKKYYGNINHLVNQSVDTLAKHKEVLDLKYRNEKVIESLFSKYLEAFKLSLVTPQMEELTSIPNNQPSFDCNHPNVETCLNRNIERQIPADKFVQKLNEPIVKDPILSLADFYDEKIIKEREISQKVCEYVVRSLGTSTHKSLTLDRRIKSLRLRRLRDKLRTYCQDSTYTFNKIIRANGVEKFIFLGGKTVNFDLGSGKSIVFNETFERETSFEVNPLGILAAFSQKVCNVISGLAAYTFAGVNRHEYGYGESSELTSTTYLSMQRATFDVTFRQPQLCVEVRPRLDFAQKIYETLENAKDLVDYDLKPLVEGYVICDPGQSKGLQEQYFRERYYYFAQHFTEGHMLDDGSILNHPWLLGLRGERDYLRFVNLLGVKPKSAERDMSLITQFFKYVTSPSQQDSERLADSFTENNLAELPLDQISGAFDNVLPSFPGIYSVGERKKEYPYD